MMKKILRNIFTIILIILIIQIQVVALDFNINNKEVDPELLCLMSSSFYEKKYNIPKNLLRSISIVESGKWNSEHKLTFAWPWIIGIDGKGQYFKSYSEAVVFLRKAIARGDNVDIGCHQINWKYHGHNFNKPEDLLHPKINAAYAAHFLIEKFNSSQDWSKAVAYYHSYTPEFGNRYLKKVHQILENMKGKNAHKYDDYLAKNISRFQHKVKSNYKNLKSQSHINKQYKHQMSDMVVFSVELPGNSAILSE